jgi:hypothetical protein
MLSFVYPHSSSVYRVDDRLLGPRLTCPDCGQAFRLSAGKTVISNPKAAIKAAGQEKVAKKSCQEPL